MIPPRDLSENVLQELVHREVRKAREALTSLTLIALAEREPEPVRARTLLASAPLADAIEGAWRKSLRSLIPQSRDQAVALAEQVLSRRGEPS